jgi:ATP phosphoribosyltransferase regulatory subunit
VSDAPVPRRPSIAPIPPGARDLAGAAVRRRRALEQRALERLAAAGYMEIVPPTFEYGEVFTRAGGPDVSDRLIRFFDLDGRLLALRYDFTASVARLAATKLADAPPPLRLCYAGRVYRQEPGRESGRPRETLQIGGELLGVDGVEGDVEAVRLAIALLADAGAREFQINLGHVGALAPALARLPEESRAVARRLVDRKDAAGLAALAPGVLAELPFVIGRREALDRARQLLSGSPAAAAVARLSAVDAALTPAERPHVVYDFGEVRGLDYYTGIHFEVFVAGAGSAVGAGGRYDDLMGRFGRPLPAVGLALDLDAIADALP